MEGEQGPGAKQRYYAIKDGNRYFVAVAVLEYDPGKAKDAGQKSGVGEVERMFANARSAPSKSASSPEVADITQEFASLGCMNTSPFPV